MKKFFILILTAVSMSASAQIKAFCLAPSCPQTVTTADSVTILAQLTTSDGSKSITWLQTGGPAIKLPAATSTMNTNLQLTSSFQLKNLPAGNYVFTATGVSVTGVTGSVTDSLTVIPAPRRIAYTITVYSDSTRVTTQ